MPNPYGFVTTCTEFADSPTEQGTPDSFRAVVRLRCAWNDRYALSNEASYAIYPRTGVGAVCRSIGIAPFGAPTATPDAVGLAYESAAVTLEYSYDRNTPEQQGTELWSEQLDPTAENLTLDPAAFIWSDGSDLKENEAPAILMRGLDYVFTRYNLSAIPPYALDLVGCCNAAPWTTRILGLTFGTQTLLFNPPSASRRVVIGPTPELKWTVVYRLTYKRYGWNQFWNPRKTGGAGFDYLKIRKSGATYYQYPPGDFSVR